MTTTETKTAAAKSALIHRRSVINRIQHQNENDGAALQNDLREQAASKDISDVLVKLSDRERLEVDAIDAALSRIHQGTWGQCAACSKKIGGNRLTAMPEAALCLTCADEASQPRR